MLFADCWYAIQVRARSERAVAELLSIRGYEPFLPTRIHVRRAAPRLSRVEVPLFPGYLFCRGTTVVTAPLLTTPGVIRIVGTPGRPIAVEEIEIDSLRRVVASQLNATPCSVRVGQTVRVGSGPLAGVVGVVERFGNGGRLFVTISLLQRSVVVELESHWLIGDVGESWVDVRQPLAG